MEVSFYEFDMVNDEKLKFAVIMARYEQKWIFVQHKDRETWEIPGGHREQDEAIERTAARELYEETGASRFNIKPVCVYCVRRTNADVDENAYTESFGGLFVAEIQTLGALPEMEIKRVSLFEKMPEKLTYPLIQPYLYNRILNMQNNDLV